MILPLVVPLEVIWYHRHSFADSTLARRSIVGAFITIDFN